MKVSDEKLSRVEIITNMAKVEALRSELGKYGITGMTVFEAKGCGVQLGTQEYEVEKTDEPKLLDKQVVMVVMPTSGVDKFLEFVGK